MTLEEKIFEVDMFLSYCEDWMRGEDSITVTHCRKLLIEISEEINQLKKVPASICACGSNEFFVEHYKDVVKYYCRECKEKIPSKN